MASWVHQEPQGHREPHAMANNVRQACHRFFNDSKDYASI
jgi:hypothetical protein